MCPCVALVPSALLCAVNPVFRFTRIRGFCWFGTECGSLVSAERAVRRCRWTWGGPVFTRGCGYPCCFPWVGVALDWLSLPSPAADSKFIVITGQHVSKALQLEAEDRQRRHELVPDTMTRVNATIVYSGALSTNWDSPRVRKSAPAAGVFGVDCFFVLLRGWWGAGYRTDERDHRCRRPAAAEPRLTGLAQPAADRTPRTPRLARTPSPRRSDRVRRRGMVSKPTPLPPPVWGCMIRPITRICGFQLRVPGVGGFLEILSVRPSSRRPCLE